MRKNVNIFSFLFVFFIVVALGSLFVLNSAGSVFDRDEDTIGAEVAVMSQSVIGTSDQDTEIADTEQQTSREEDYTESDDEEIEKIIAEIDAEKAEISDDLADANNAIEEERDAYLEAGQEDEAVTEYDTSIEEPGESDDGLLYYTFRIQTEGSSLNLRRGPGTDTKVMARLDMSTVGYVLQPGNEWTRVYTEDGQEGYLASEYLIVDKVTAEDFPEDIREKVEAPTEELTSAFEANG